MKYLLFITFFVSNLNSQSCNKNIPDIVVSENAQNIYTSKLLEAKQKFKTNPNANNLIWLGRRYAYLGKYNDAINIYSNGITKYPNDARFYRHRGHRYLSIRCFDLAIKDLQKAAELTQNKKNEMEPDGLPNALNIPTSTLQGNIYYHLGLAFYCIGNYKQAEEAYEKCIELAENPDSYIAAANWLYVIYRHLGQNLKANILLKSIDNDIELIENHSYHTILKIHKGTIDPIALENKIMNEQSLQNTTIAFGLGNYYDINGNKDKAQNIFKMINNGNQWSSFGFIVAERKLDRD
ncbi:MAG: hypothetical protein CMG08_01475 [Candidatus Marinimicrobia bacterium]|nr:hypothetical protein [Candidatus Neomarinimicrobiota bacterium]